MNKTVREALLERRSIRRYTRDVISKDEMDFIYAAIRNTPTSYNGEQFSVIDIDDQELKEQIYALTNQKQVKTCNRFLVFCADFHKFAVAAAAKGIDAGYFGGTVDGYTVGVIDASLAMMSASVAAESLGLAVCPIGYARTAAPDALSELLGLPRGVAVVCGLAIGVGREMPDMKPKQPESLLIHHNRYRGDAGMVAELAAFDAEVSEYNRTRSGLRTDNDWVGHMADYYREGESYRMLEAMERRGFLTVRK